MSILERTRTSTPPAVALPIGPRTAAVLVLASIGGLMMLCWPLLLVAQPGDRVEPPFKLQGSYRNMNKLAEKISPVMNAASVGVWSGVSSVFCILGLSLREFADALRVGTSR